MNSLLCNCFTFLAAVLLLPSVLAECEVESSSYSSSDGLVVSKVAHITTFTAKCDDRQSGLSPLYADLNGQTLPAIRSSDSSKSPVYQISWTVELSKASSGSYSIPIYDEEGFTALRKAQRAGQTPPKPLFTLNVSHSSPYKGPLIQSELVAALSALGLWWVAYSAKTKLTN